MGNISSPDNIVHTFAAALGYAGRGWKVFPCRLGSKLPMTKNGHLEATTDEKVIRAWWTAEPNANIGLSLAASGLVAIDPDIYKAECEWASFSEGKPIPDTFTQRTARGGIHYVFATEPSESFSGKLCQEVEIKHQGYIVLTPSIFEGERYEIVKDCPPAPCPDWVPRKQARAELPDCLLNLAKIKADAGRGISTDPEDLPELVTVDKLRAALAVIPSDEQPVWFEVICAIRHRL